MDSQEVSQLALWRPPDVDRSDRRVGGSEYRTGSLATPLADTLSGVKRCVLRAAYIIID